METYPVTESQHLPPAALRHIALAGPLDEICNAPGSVRHHLFWHGWRDKETNKLGKSMLFFIYQTGRHGPQNGFRLCVVHQGYHVTSPTKDESDAGKEDDIDRVERPIAQGLMEVVVLGEVPAWAAEEDDAGGVEFVDDSS
ncbi:hypothetical protein B0H63DRAFT_480832 [Podospora didyma]|uniref:Uncharacterized protein n=1 Tax=Podospora didyma TaxID=330526 RepID=A0AAE0KDJ6_9PEZI|nr:hypothetical protein B0H63DRAFT_480832 [Podospora didyma]